MALLGLALTVGATPALAGTFDAAGRLVLDETAVRFNLDALDTLPAGASFRLFDSNSEPLDDAALAALFEADPEARGLEGAGALVFGGDSAIFGSMRIDEVLTNLSGRRVAIQLWQRPEGTLADISVSFRLGGNGGFGSGITVGNISLRPTGRVTSDGWREYSTGAFDYSAGGVAEPGRIRISDQQVTLLQTSYAAGFDFEARVRIDAMEIVDLGPALVPPVECNAVDVLETCTDQGVCVFGRCVDSAVADGAALTVDDQRADYLERRIFEFEAFEGGRIPQSRMSALRDRLEPLKTEPYDAAFWPTFRQAVNDLQDGHASAAAAELSFPLGGGVCLHLGEADLLDSAIRPMVFKRAGSGPLASDLLEGDVLVAVDDLPVADWVALNPRHIGHGGDPAAYDLATTPDIVNAALRTGATMTFERCAVSVDGAPCSDAEKEVLTFDLAALFGDAVWGGTFDGWAADAAGCDWRFDSPITDANRAAYEFAGSTIDADNIAHLLINGVPSLQSEDGAAWESVVRNTLAAVPERLMLDQRQGRGGTLDAVDLLTTWLVDDSEYFSADMITWWDLNDSVAEKNAVMTCNPGFVSQGACGNSFRWFHGFSVNQTGGAATTKLAVLNGQDVSGNDYTSRMLQFRSADTRFFGNGSAYGAYGVIWQLPSYIGETSGGSFQVHDTVFLASINDFNLDYSTSVGVVPDEIVYQKQSDALAGIDTTIEAARAWLLAE